MANSRMRQLDPGTYIVKQDGVEVGKCYATGTANELVVEHWILYKSFASPTTTLTMKVTEATTPYTSLSAFTTAMQTEIDSQGEDGVYVKATCVYEDFPTS